jgi:hypothetical protein
MKTWKFALIAVAAGLIHGMTSSEPPFPSLQRAVVAMTHLPVSRWVERIGKPGQTALTTYANTIVRYARSKDTTSIASAAHGESDRIALEDRINKPTNWKSNSEPQRQTPAVRPAEGLFSVHVNNANLLDVLKDLGKECDIDIVNEDALADKAISVKLNSIELEDGIRQLMRIAGVENYALSYRKESGNQYIVSQIICLPGEATDSDHYLLTKATQEADLSSLSELPLEAQKELREEIPAELRDQVLSDIPEELLAELREG